jgi:transposase
MSESRGIGWHFGERSMAKPYSDDLRERVVEAVKAGASRREAAERFEIAPSSAIKWLQRWRETGSASAFRRDNRFNSAELSPAVIRYLLILSRSVTLIFWQQR